MDVARLAIAPDWVCEVLSPATEAYDRDEKMTIYGANAVGCLWLLDVANRAIEVFASERGKWREIGVFSGNEDARVPPFDAVPLPMSWLWAR